MDFHAMPRHRVATGLAEAPVLEQVYQIPLMDYPLSQYDVWWQPINGMNSAMPANSSPPSPDRRKDYGDCSGMPSDLAGMMSWRCKVSNLLVCQTNRDKVCLFFRVSLYRWITPLSPFPPPPPPPPPPPQDAIYGSYLTFLSPTTFRKRAPVRKYGLFSFFSNFTRNSIGLSTTGAIASATRKNCEYTIEEQFRGRLILGRRRSAGGTLQSL
ncbi:hypothetical protein K470DRAFT_65918 [Piedraia hortae CBS 480.64]|uniref:Uncharacterized protein n=1 Tax=Piedraia hortae CBS 480.64 TaxID=1314780 RepID=A0A6A7C0G9_9PEZI|nr:hypothetical protein K470DRAFT_65918 [Piedraia hortae CBS 480.64]